MYEPVLNAQCKTCRGILLIAPALAPTEQRHRTCGRWGTGHVYSAEDVYVSGAKLERISPRTDARFLE